LPVVVVVVVVVAKVFLVLKKLFCHRLEK